MSNFLKEYRFLQDPLKKSFLKNIAVFFSGSLIALTATVAVQFILPKILSIQDYGLYKSFALYLSYTSLLHFGLKDGIYIALCRKTFNKRINISYFTFLVIQQFILLILMLTVSFFFDATLKTILICLSITSFFFIINTYYDSLFQSQKNFKTVSLLKIVKEITFLLLIILIYFFSEKPNVTNILIAFLTSIIVTSIIYTIVSRKLIGLSKISASDIELMKPIYNRGFKLLIGNFGNQINGNIDKLFVNFLYPIEMFAYYSFGGMFFVLTNTFVNSISTVLLPYLFKEFNQDLKYKHKQLNKLTTMLAVLMSFYLIGVFYLVKYFYVEYLSSIPIIALFYIGMVYSIKINLIQNNYLKTLNLDKKYIQNNYKILLGFVLIMITLNFFKFDIYYFALATSSVMYLRYRLNLKSINLELQENQSFYFDDLFILFLGILVFLYSNYIVI